MNLAAEAAAWHQAGYVPVPTAVDGSKRPALLHWKHLQDQRPSADQVNDWFTMMDTDGLGLITGAVSGGLTMFELEGRAIREGLLETLTTTMQEHNMGGLWARLMAGYVEQTPSGGLHILYRCERTHGNTKLARRPSTTTELAGQPQAKVQVLIETRGEGGFVVIAPSKGRTHPNGTPWVAMPGHGPTTVPTITGDEQDALFAISSTLDQIPAKEDTWGTTAKGDTTTATPATNGYAPTADTRLRPGDDFTNRATWDDILTPHGWVKSKHFGGDCYGWTRPGKNPHDGISATTGRNDADLLYVFTSSTELETETPLSKFRVYTQLNHAGNYSAAAKTLAQAGYGTQPDPVTVGDLYTLAGKETPWETTAEHANTPPVTPPSPSPCTTAPCAGPGVAEPVNTPEPPTTSGTRQPTGREPTSAADNDDDEDDPEVLAAVRQLLVADKARKVFRRIIEPEAQPFDAGTLAELLQRPPDPPMRAEGLIPWGGSALMVAQKKIGKTTLMLNYARSLLTGADMLGAFPVIKLQGTVTMLNYEVSAAQIARWAGEHNIPQDRMQIVTLRGRRNPLSHAEDRAALAQLMRGWRTEAVIIDPFGRAYYGASQNDNGEVGSFLVDLDTFARTEVGATDLMLAAHAGWGADGRARGASALEDWPDVIMTLTRGGGDEDSDETDTPRFFKAEGRDVDIAEDQITYDPITREIGLTGHGGKKAARKSNAAAQLASVMEKVIYHKGTVGSRTELLDACRAEGARWSKDPAKSPIAAAFGLLAQTETVSITRVGRQMVFTAIQPR